MIGFSDFQRWVAHVLLIWGLGNVAAGILAARSSNPVFRHAGLQSIAWGAIDAALALVGHRAAHQQGREATRARRFRTIVAVNTGLDLLYAAAGALTIHKARGRGDRAGIGVGIIIQSTFLFVFDAVLTWLSGRWARR